MTFDEWFDTNYPFGYPVLSRSAGEQLAREAWEAGFQAGQDAAECRQDKVWSKIHNDQDCT
jgi:hypothetical protein